MRKKAGRGRQPVQRSLPPLAETCAGFRGFHDEATRLDQISEILAAVIHRHRRSTPQAFYAMRDAAAFFGVALTTMAKVYRRLSREGALTLVRSSQSMVAARIPRPRFAVRGVVCMPIWLPGFLQFLDWRKWFSQLEEELAYYHFVLEPIFYKATEEVKPGFVDRVLRFNPDFVLWSWPSQVDRMTMQSIADAGVPLVLVQHAEEPLFPGRVYRMNNRIGLGRGLAEWAASGEIKEIVIPIHLNHELIVMPAIKAGPFPCRVEAFELRNKSTTEILGYLQGLAKDRRTGVIFADDLLYSHICTLVPDGMFELMRRHRVLVIRQVTIPSASITPPPGLTVDALVYPWKELARRIAMDLGKSQGSVTPDILEAEWRPQTPLAGMIQTFLNE